MDLQPTTPYNTPKFIPIEKLISLSEQGLSGPQIAKQVGCDPSNVYQRFQSFGYTTDRAKAFNSAKPTILSIIQSKILNAIDDDEIKRAPLQTKVWCYGVLHDKQADLERRSQSAIVDDASYDDLTHQLTRLAARSPIIINNILNVVGSLPADIRDRVQAMIPSSLPDQVTLEGVCK